MWRCKAGFFSHAECKTGDFSQKARGVGFRLIVRGWLRFA